MGSDWAHLVAEASRRHGAAPAGTPASLLLPWERGLAGAVLGGGLALQRALAPALYGEPPAPDPPPVPRLPLPVLLPGPRSAKPPRSAPIPRIAPRTSFGKVRRKAKAHPAAKATDAERRERVIDSWTDIGIGIPGGELYVQCDGNRSEVRRSLTLIFTGKSTATLAKRAAALRGFQRWHAGMDLPGGAFPAQEEILFRHLAELYDEGAAATRGQALLEALNLASATFGFSAEAQASARVRGAAAASFAQKRGTLQRPPLTVAALRVLEDGVVTASTACDRIFCGFLAFLAHTRTRFLDGARISAEPFIDESGSVAFVETRSTEHKGGNRPRVRGLALPVVGHAVGIRGEPWAEAWLEARRMMGLNADVDGALMLTPSGGDHFTSRRLSTTEGAIWLREVLIDGGVITLVMGNQLFNSDFRDSSD